MILKYFISFFLISALHLVAELISWNNISICTKPLLMPLLLVGIYGATNKKTRLAFPFRAAFVALIFSTAGDVFLLMEKGTHQDIYFFLGLGAFLIAHYMYIRTFLSLGSNPIRLRWIGLYMVYLIFFLGVLYPGMPLSLKIPVTLYGIVLTTMAWYAWRACSSFSFFGLLPVIGSFLFVASDSLLAINRFRMPIPYAGFLIMLTYLLAQFSIIQGVLLKIKSESNQVNSLMH